MKIRLKRPWSQWSRGHVFTDMPGGQARTLLALGIAEQVIDEPAALESPANRMARPRVTKIAARSA